MHISNIIALLSGIALFLFGMAFMGDGLKLVAGGSLETTLYKLSSTPLRGTLLGTGVTAVIQSSGATSIMAVGFVNSGMMKFHQAIGIVLGSIFGTSVTGWVLCLSNIGGENGWLSLISTTTITGIAAVAGILLRITGGTSKRFHVGNIMMGFAVLLVGMGMMSDSVAPLAEEPAFIEILTGFTNPILGILMGVLAACVVQSASAAVGILQALAVTGTVSFQLAFPMILGIAIGSSVPVLLSSFGANTDGKRTSFSYLYINIIGTLVCGILFYALNAIMPFPLMDHTMSMFSIAALNSIVRFVIVVLLLPFLGQIEKLICATIRDSGSGAKDGSTANATDYLDGLDDRFLSHPALAVVRCGAVMEEVAGNAKDALLKALSLLTNYDDTVYEEVSRLEQRLDQYEDRLGAYIMRLTAQELTEQQTKELSRYLHSLSDFERIADYAIEIAKCLKNVHQKNIVFSEQAMKELHVLQEVLTEMISVSVEAFLSADVAKASTVEPIVRLTNRLCGKLKLRHMERMQSGTCSFENGFTFNDLLSNYERVGGHCSNIAMAILATRLNILDTHEYLSELMQQQGGMLRKLYQTYKNRYKV